MDTLKKVNYTKTSLQTLLSNDNAEIREEAVQFYARNLLTRIRPMLSLQQTQLGYNVGDPLKKPVFATQFFVALTENAIFINDNLSWHRYFNCISQTIEKKLYLSLIFKMLIRIYQEASNRDIKGKAVLYMNIIGHTDDDVAVIAALLAANDKKLIEHALIRLSVSPLGDLGSCNPILKTFAKMPDELYIKYQQVLQNLAESSNTQQKLDIFDTILLLLSRQQASKKQVCNLSMLEETFRSAVGILINSKVALKEKTIEKLVNVIINTTCVFSNKTSFEVITYLLDNTSLNNLCLTDCFWELGRLVVFGDRQYLLEACPYFAKAIKEGCMENKVKAMTTVGQILLFASKKDSHVSIAVQRSYLRVFLTDVTFFKKLNEKQVKLSLSLLFRLRNSKSLEMSVAAGSAIEKLLANYNIYSMPLCVYEFAVLQTEEIWRLIFSKVKLVAYANKSYLVEEIINRYQKAEEIGQGRYMLLLERFIRKQLFNYEDYRRISELLNKAQLVPDAELRMTKSAKAKANGLYGKSLVY